MFEPSVGTVWKVIGLVVAIILIIGLIIFGATPGGRAAWNSWFFSVHKADDATNYETLKKVEDTARAMISSYEADKATYEQYKDSTDANEKEWAAGAMMRANRTASSYNNYITQNSFQWKGGLPNDIRGKLDVIKKD